MITLNLAGMAVQETYEAPGDVSQVRDVVVPAGTTAEVARSLAVDGVIAHPLVFRAAVWFTRNQGPIKAGEFSIPARASLREILTILRTISLTSADQAVVLASIVQEETPVATELPQGGRKGSASFLKKRSKKLLL